MAGYTADGPRSDDLIAEKTLLCSFRDLFWEPNAQAGGISPTKDNAEGTVSSNG